MIGTITANNFTVFKKDFVLHASEGINLVVGENGAGKTHLLKGIYADSFSSDSAFAEVFGEKNLGIARGHEYAFICYHLPEQMKEDAVYIPVKDVLTHSKGLLSMADKYRDFPFDKTLLDIIRKANQWQLKKIPEIAMPIVSKLEMILEGKVVIEDEEFFVQKNNGQKVSFAVEAEGLKKIGLLWQLLMTESIKENGLLLWDEPDANLNPKYFSELVECLLELSRHGVQIFLSTHNYVLAKYFDIRRKDTDKVKVHALYRTADGVEVETRDLFKDLQHNAIMETFDALLDEVYYNQVKV